MSLTIVASLEPRHFTQSVNHLGFFRLHLHLMGFESFSFWGDFWFFWLFSFFSLIVLCIFRDFYFLFFLYFWRSFLSFFKKTSSFSQRHFLFWLYYLDLKAAKVMHLVDFLLNECVGSGEDLQKGCTWKHEEDEEQG